jgi:predicted dehydrogenase
MADRILRVGLIGAGACTRLRHLPGLHAQTDVEIAAVCDRRLASTVAMAREFAFGRRRTRVPL